MPRSGVSYSAEFEAREAAQWGGHTWRTFCAEDGDEQSAIVAHYRTHHQIEAVLAAAEAKKMKQQRKSAT